MLRSQFVVKYFGGQNVGIDALATKCLFDSDALYFHADDDGLVALVPMQNVLLVTKVECDDA